MKKMINFSVVVSITALVLSVYISFTMPQTDIVKVTEVTKLTEIPYNVLNQPLAAKIVAIGPVDGGKAIYSVEIDGKLHKSFITYDTLTFISANIGDIVEVSWSHGLGMLEIIAGTPRGEIN